MILTVNEKLTVDEEVKCVFRSTNGNMTVLTIYPEKRSIALVIRTVAARFSDQAELCRYLGAVRLSKLKLSSGILLFNEDQSCGTHAFSFTDSSDHVIVGKAVYIPHHQTGIVGRWNFEIDKFVRFFGARFSKIIKHRIANGSCAILPEEWSLGKPVNRKSTKDEKASGIVRVPKL